MPYFIYAQKAIEPQFEAKSIHEMCTELAKRMGVEKEFTEGRTQEQWIEHLYAETRKNDPTLPTFSKR
ncbi:hypothetical protein OK016_01880 [Vibrio chagasii]|nr:hypothetical protein [Vibrio chagasii]